MVNIMSNSLIQDYKNAQKNADEAKEWNDLPNGRVYQSDSFDISEAHCTPPVLVRAGQQYCGGQNYWESNEEFNNALLTYIISDWDNIYTYVMEIMNKRKDEKLKKCQTFIDEMQELINGVGDIEGKNENI